MNVPEHTKSQEIFNTFLKDGVAVAENFFTVGEVTVMRDELMPHYEKMQDGDLMVYEGETQEQGYPFGKMIRITDKHFHKFEMLYSVFNHNWFYGFTDSFLGSPNNKNLQTFCPYEYLTPEKAVGTTRNSHPHVDPYFALKYFIYLSDTHKSNGAFKALRGSHIEGGRYRQSQSLDHMTKEGYKDLNGAFEALNATEEDMEYIEAPAGSLIVVNTDALHAGGTLEKEGESRMTIMNHNRKY